MRPAAGDHRQCGASSTSWSGSQFFTTSTDGGITYRYHQVLQAYLEVVLVDELGGSAGPGPVLPQRPAAGGGRPNGSRRTRPRTGRGLGCGRSAAAAHRVHAACRGRPAVGLDEPVGSAGRRSRPAGGERAATVAGRHDRRGRDRVPARRGFDGRPDFRARWADERAIAAVWLPDAVIEPGRQPSTDRGLRLARELRHSLLTVGDLNDPESLVRGLNRLLSGQTAAAYSTLQVALSAPGLAAWAAARAAVGGAARGAGGAGELTGPASSRRSFCPPSTEGLSWLSRVARGLQAVQLLMSDPTPWRMATCADLVIDCERQIDGRSVCSPESSGSRTPGRRGWQPVAPAGGRAGRRTERGRAGGLGRIRWPPRASIAQERQTPRPKPGSSVLPA